jgi:hypothetical protein
MKPRIQITASFNKYPHINPRSSYELHQDEVSHYIELGIPVNGKLKIIRLDQKKIVFSKTACSDDNHVYSDILNMDQYEEIDA